MLHKKNSTSSLHLVTDEDTRRAEAQKQLNRTVVKILAIRVGVSVAAIIATRIVMKKMEQTEAAVDSED